ncbi:oxaloacetate decarboxylase [uncultured Ruthenibacterium sp.]|uniref:isocitrate lyase/PEP mutase family protein n=1 Tax=uncultured Ruthenibacterium sp. TaxID=1905347 RepID=UPI00349E5950
MKKKLTGMELFNSGKQIFAPCVYDCMSARAAEKSGYPCMMLSGGAIAYSMDGQPDMAFGTLDEVITIVEAITNCVDIPLLVDFDDGYGESPAVIYRNVKRLIRAGAAGFTLDDSTGFRGFERMEYYKANPNEVNPVTVDPTYKTISRQKWLAKIKAAVAACEGTGCVCIARTEAGPSYGMDEAILRCVLAKKLGAPMTTVCGGMNDLAMGTRVAEKDIGWKMWPDVIVINGKPSIELSDAEKLGFNLVTMHVFEKSALYGMIKYGQEDLKNKNVVFSTKHAMGGLSVEEQKELLSMR